MKDKQPQLECNSDAPPATAGGNSPAPAPAMDKREAEIAAIRADRLAQADIHTRFDATRFRRKEQR